VTVLAGFGHSVGQLDLAVSHRPDGGTDTAQTAGVGVGRCNGCWVERVEPPLGIGGRLLELLAGSGHSCYLF
jgi:hypothetical protein